VDINFWIILKGRENGLLYLDARKPNLTTGQTSLASFYWHR